MVIVVVKLAICMGCLVHRKQFNVWFLGDTKYSWLDKTAYPIYCSYNSLENPAVNGLSDTKRIILHLQRILKE